MRLCHLIPLTVMLTVLSGCAQTGSTHTATDWETHQKQLQGLTHYQAKGVFGYLSPEQRISLAFNWKNNHDDYQLRLTKLYKTVLNLKAESQTVTLVDPDGNIYHGNNAAQLVKQLTGIELPLSRMRDWLVGLPTSADTYQLNRQDQVAYLAKAINGQTWELYYQAYNTNTPALPTQMVLHRGNLKIKIKISDWLIN